VKKIAPVSRRGGFQGPALRMVHYPLDEGALATTLNDAAGFEVANGSNSAALLLSDSGTLWGNSGWLTADGANVAKFSGTHPVATIMDYRLAGLAVGESFTIVCSCDILSPTALGADGSIVSAGAGANSLRFQVQANDGATNSQARVQYQTPAETVQDVSSASFIANTPATAVFAIRFTRTGLASFSTVSRVGVGATLDGETTLSVTQYNTAVTASNANHVGAFLAGVGTDDSITAALPSLTRVRSLRLMRIDADVLADVDEYHADIVARPYTTPPIVREWARLAG
jgi:hypothetical protein